MPTITTDDDVKLYYEEAGSGTPIVFVHEFAGDWRSWEPQIRYFSRRYRCISYSARGYLPTRKRACAMTSSPSLMDFRSNKPISLAFRWAHLRACILAWCTAVKA